MSRGTLIPSSAEVELICLRSKAGTIQMEVRACRSSSTCPICGTGSTRLHSRYRRVIADLPWEGLPVRILLHTRRFFCVNERCSRLIFTERFSGTVRRYARRSCRSSEALRWVTLELGGRAGARLGSRLGLLASGSTLLRELRKRTRSTAAAFPRVLGIDEWAWKKGHRYGTILCDLERGRVIDLLPTRDSDAVAAWLRRHPSVQIVSRDRAGAFADAISKGAPAAQQVADRWHLLNNLIETLGRSLERHRGTISEVREVLWPQSAQTTPLESPTQALQRTQQKRQTRLELYQKVKTLIDGGMSHSEVSRRLEVSLRTVQRWVACGVFPERKRGLFPTSVDAFGPYLEKRIAEGCTNAAELWRELKQQGFSGKAFSVWSWLRKRFGRLRQLAFRPRAKKRPALCLQHVIWLMLKADPGKHRYLKALYRASPELASLGRIAESFFEIIRNRDASAWPAWLQTAMQSPLASFCASAPAGSGGRRRRIAAPLEQWHGRRPDPSAEADQAANVRSRRL